MLKSELEKFLFREIGCVECIHGQLNNFDETSAMIAISLFDMLLLLVQ